MTPPLIYSRASHNYISAINCGGNRIRTYEVIRQQIYSLSQLAALVFPLKYFHLPLQICTRYVSENLEFQYFLEQNLFYVLFWSALQKQECKIIRFSTFSKLLWRKSKILSINIFGRHQIYIAMISMITPSPNSFRNISSTCALCNEKS
jgi:hypothetical protein